MLPPVPIKLSFDVWFTFTLSQLASISSAISIGKDVHTPCPISAFETDSMIVSSLKTLTNVSGEKLEAWYLDPIKLLKPIAKPDPIMDVTLINSLRDITCSSAISNFLSC